MCVRTSDADSCSLIRAKVFISFIFGKFKLPSTGPVGKGSVDQDHVPFA